MADFILQLAVAAEVAQVVAREGVAQGILLPAVAAGIPPRLGAQSAPVLHPLRRAYFGRFFLAELCQQPRQRLVDGHQARASGLTVLRKDADGSALQIHLLPREPRHLMRAYARIQHHAHRRQAAAPAVAARVHMLDGLHRGVLLDELFSEEGVGAMVHADSYLEIRPLHEDDIPELLSMIARCVADAKLVERTYESIHARLDSYYVYTRMIPSLVAWCFTPLSRSSAPSLAACSSRKIMRAMVTVAPCAVLLRTKPVPWALIGYSLFPKARLTTSVTAWATHNFRVMCCRRPAALSLRQVGVPPPFSGVI